MMGSPPDESHSHINEGPQHLVTLSDFWLAETQVTNAQYGEYMKSEGGVPEPAFWRNRRFSGKDQPVVGISWHDAVAFCKWLSQTSGQVIELPTEAQWERSVRGTDGRRYPWGVEPPSTTRACFGQDRGTGQAAPVGEHPLGRGLFGHSDLAGNVWEWCRDVWNARAYSQTNARAMVDPVNQDRAAQAYVRRGGSWSSHVGELRAAARHGFAARAWDDDLGFRVCCSL
jgi:formylglycine-generating enzyme required for sulfatase activity